MADLRRLLEAMLRRYFQQMVRYVSRGLPGSVAATLLVAAALGALALGLSGATRPTIEGGTPAAIVAAPADAMAVAAAEPDEDGSDRRAAAPAAPEYSFVWPASGAISQGMTARHPRGLDIAAERGDQVNAARAGDVVSAGGDPCCVYGLHVIVQHDDGWSSLYAHLDSLVVQLGDRVQQGESLGLAGDTGRADGVHVHFELLSLGAPVNPLKHLQPLRSYTPVIEPAEAPVSIEQPELTIEDAAGASAGEAIDAARRWMARQGEAGYQVDHDSCFAIVWGLNWSVSCTVMPWGCEEAVCRSLAEACVIVPLMLVEATCSGY